MAGFVVLILVVLILEGLMLNRLVKLLQVAAWAKDKGKKTPAARIKTKNNLTILFFILLRGGLACAGIITNICLQ